MLEYIIPLAERQVSHATNYHSHQHVQARSYTDGYVSPTTPTEDVAENAVAQPREFKDDDAKTLVEGKGRRDVNGKIMTKRELAAEGVMKIVWVVM
jgi:hypothetical protein